MKINYYQSGKLYLSSSANPLLDLTQNYQGPVYAYHLGGILDRWNQYRTALDGTRAFYAVKANSNREILRNLFRSGCGADVVSGGELARAIECGCAPQSILFSGVGKTKEEIRQALDQGIKQLNVESYPELQRILELMRATGKQIGISLRFNPDIDVQTHPYISTGLKDNKFGMDEQELRESLNLLKSQKIALSGLSMHLGSQIKDLGALEEGAQSLFKKFKEIRNEHPSLKHLDLGGGLGIDYEVDHDDQEIARLANWGETVRKLFFENGVANEIEISTEPGRFLVARFGVLIAQVQYIKRTQHKVFVILDTGMTHLIRPALYSARHRILPLKLNASEQITCDVVGPICESSDCFGQDYQLTSLAADDFVAIVDAGAYGYSMASEYNLQKLPQEICLS